MRPRLSGAGLAGLLLLVAGCGDGRSGRDVLERAAAAANAATRLRYEYSFEGSGTFEGSYRGRLTRLEQDGRSYLEVSIDGGRESDAGAQPVGLTIVTDGVSVWSLDRTRGLFFRGSVSGGGTHLLAPVGFAIPPPFATGTFLDAAVSMSGAEAAREGETEADGVACDVVRTRSEAFGGGDVWWTVGREDGLPRALRWTLDAPGVSGGFEFRATRVETGFAVEPEAFTLAPPADVPIIDEDRRSVNVGDPAPDWTLETPDARRVTLSALRGEVAVLVFRAGWCEECSGLIAALDSLVRESADRPVHWLVLDTWDGAPGTDPAPGDHGPSELETVTRGESIAPWYKVAAPPALFVVDRQGSIALARRREDLDVGKVAAEVRAAIAAALRE